MTEPAQLSYSQGTAQQTLLGETIGANLTRVAAAFGDREAVVDVPRPAVDLCAAPRRH